MDHIALIGACPAEAEDKLNSLPDIKKVFRLPPDDLIDSPIRCHPDTILCVYGENIYCHYEYAEKNRGLLDEIRGMTGLKLSPVSQERNGSYPFDCGFNALIYKNTVIGRKKSLCQPLSEICEDTNQGYAACSSLAAGDCILTSDPSVIKVLSKLNIPYRELYGQDIELDGYKNGFIGGCGGSFENKVCVFGDPSLTETGKQLSDFCREKSLDLISLCGGKLTDHGGIIFIGIR